MKIKYFEDTDTTLLEIGTGLVAETRELSEDVYLDLDGAGNVNPFMKIENIIKAVNHNKDKPMPLLSTNGDIFVRVDSNKFIFEDSNGDQRAEVSMASIRELLDELNKSSCLKQDDNIPEVYINVYAMTLFKLAES